ncbi:MAG: ATP-binding protein [Cyanophyceae cyanobacterium]
MAGDRPTVNYADFCIAIDPQRTLNYGDKNDRLCYVDFTPIRGDKMIRKLKNRIITYGDKRTCSLFMGHVGCGKSTELLRLKKELENDKFFVIYFKGDDYLDKSDISIAGVLFVIAGQVARSLEKEISPVSGKLQQLVLDFRDTLFTEFTVEAQAEIVGQKVAIDSAKKELKLSTIFGDLTMRAKNDPKWRTRLNDYVTPQLTPLIEGINKDLIRPGIEQLKVMGYRGLTIIIDNLDRIDNRSLASGRSSQELLFIDKAEDLASLDCHTVYTMPLRLRFSGDFGGLKNRFSFKPECLPMVPTMTPDGDVLTEGIEKLKQMVFARVLPGLSEEERVDQALNIFESEELLERVCRVSGGHIRGLFRLLLQWAEEEMLLPLTKESLEEVIGEEAREMQFRISEEEWALLRRVHRSKEVSEELQYQKLIRTQKVFEYSYSKRTWFDVNPILLEGDKL